jgi:polyhydroxyalkanoate synthase
LQQEYLQSVQSLADGKQIQALLAKDKRFAKPEWSANPVASMAAANYLLGSRMLTGMAEAVQGDENTQSRAFCGRAMGGGHGAQQFSGAERRCAQQGC